MKAHNLALLNTGITLMVLLVLGQISDLLGKLILPFIVYIIASPFVAIGGVICGLYELKHQTANDVIIVVTILNLICALAFFIFSKEIFRYLM